MAYVWQRNELEQVDRVYMRVETSGNDDVSVPGTACVTRDHRGCT